jgi:hypothetical protein
MNFTGLVIIFDIIIIKIMFVTSFIIYYVNLSRNLVSIQKDTTDATFHNKTAYSSSFKTIIQECFQVISCKKYCFV